MHHRSHIINENMSFVYNVKIRMWRLWTRLFILQRLDEDGDEDEARPLAESLLLAIADLLFCPNFTAQTHKKNSTVSLKPPHITLRFMCGRRATLTWLSHNAAGHKPVIFSFFIKEIYQITASGLFIDWRDVCAAQLVLLRGKQLRVCMYLLFLRRYKMW